MKKSALYAKIVEWSEEDQCVIGSAPGLVYGGCRGADEKEVFDQLCQIVEEIIDLYHKEGPSRRQPLAGILPIPCSRSHNKSASTFRPSVATGGAYTRRLAKSLGGLAFNREA